jgi:hypothetical protein
MRQPLNVRITRSHHAKLEELRNAGLSLFAIVEQGIDAVYEKMVQAQIIDGSAQREIEQAESVT